MFKRFLRDIRGNFAVIVAVSLMALLLAIGVAVDVNGLQSKRSRYQSLADTAVLAAARSGETDIQVLNDIVRDVVAANNLQNWNLSARVTVSPEGGLRVSVDGKYDTVLMNLFGKNELVINTIAEAPLPSSEPVHIVLVLDTTGSMGSNNKMGSLKIAATDLIDTLEGLNNSALKMGVVPFSQYVNIGLSRRNEEWVEYTTDYGVPLPDDCYMPVIGTENCRMEPYPATPAQPAIPPTTCYNDGVPYDCGGSDARDEIPAGSKEVCDNVYGPLEVCTPQNELHVWNGCVGSRASPWHKRHAYSNHKIPGIIDIPCGTEILALTNNMTTVKARINAMTAQYSTYIPAGLIWGWRALEPSVPLTESAGPYETKTKRVMILMTDGVNTRSKDGITHNGGSTGDANDLTKDLCENINDAHIDVYTIAYEVNDMTTRNMLRRCASQPDMYFDANNAIALKAAFKEIGANLLRLRLTH